jgi:hypothetical protein
MLAAVRFDYRTKGNMTFGRVPGFKELLEILQALQE